MRVHDMNARLVAEGRELAQRNMLVEGWKYQQMGREVRNEACLARYEREVLGVLDRLMDVGTRVTVPETTVTPEPVVASRGLRKWLSNWRVAKDTVPMASAQLAASAEAREPSLRIVLGEERAVDGLGKGVPVATVWLWNGHQEKRVPYRYRPDNVPAFVVDYGFQPSDSGAYHHSRSEKFSYNPKVPDQAQRLRYLTEHENNMVAYYTDKDECDRDPITQREAFVNGQVQRTADVVCELLQYARDPLLNPELAARFDKQAFALEA
jgi:hypothetical protein